MIAAFRTRIDQHLHRKAAIRYGLVPQERMDVHLLSSFVFGCHISVGANEPAVLVRGGSGGNVWGPPVPFSLALLSLTAWSSRSCLSPLFAPTAVGDAWVGRCAP